MSRTRLEQRCGSPHIKLHGGGEPGRVYRLFTRMRQGGTHDPPCRSLAAFHRPKGTAMRLLIVEDDPHIAELLRDGLGEE